jgi:hypothetical protein
VARDQDRPIAHRASDVAARATGWRAGCRGGRHRIPSHRCTDSLRLVELKSWLINQRGAARRAAGDRHWALANRPDERTECVLVEPVSYLQNDAGDRHFRLLRAEHAIMLGNNLRKTFLESLALVGFTQSMFEAEKSICKARFKLAQIDLPISIGGPLAHAPRVTVLPQCTTTAIIRAQLAVHCGLSS